MAGYGDDNDEDYRNNAVASTSEESAVEDPIREDKKRFLIVKEITETEASYLNSLNIIVNEYLEPIVREKILSASQVSTIFSNVASFPGLHQTILGRLNDRISDWVPGKTCIGDIFIQSVSTCPGRKHNNIKCILGPVS